ncbi:MAG: DNA-binding response regulator [Flavipsychrobacter sp.]|jgi:DNA-binding NarL/FixJ family response regulator|nr:DNA-binding response regulator [Flavipsychrobacter sp.]
MKVKVAIADDHPLVIKGLQQILSGSRDFELAGSYLNGKELLKGLVNTMVDVVLLDIHMPGQTGDELAEIISLKYPNIKMLALTNEDNVYYIKNMLRKGVHGYILKTTTESILLDAIRTVHAGQQYLEAVLSEKVIRDTIQAKKQVSANPVLSDREIEVLRYLSMDLTSQEIAEKLFVSKRTVDYYRLCLITKLGVKNEGALVKKGIQLGYIQ